MDEKSRKSLFRACFFALMATSFGFMLRAMLITEWGEEFNLTKTQMGEIMGVGLWPFAVSIVLFSLIIDKIGYGRAMAIAFICHISSLVITLLANGYWMLYIGTFIFALGNGTIEATINPAVATMFPKEKTKWINKLHAGWPAGMVVGGIIAIALGESVKWQYKIAIILIPMLTYGFLMLKKKFPVQERVAAGVSYKDMLKELGILGALIIVSLMVFEIGNFFNLFRTVEIVLIILITGAFGIYVRSLGQPVFIVLLLIMFPLATTELGTDSWIVDLMAGEMKSLQLQPGWILVYTALIMTIARFFAGPVIEKLKPSGLLIFSSAIAAAGLFFLSLSTGIMVFIAATIYGFAKSYLWPTMIGIVGERFPKGGALTLNVTTGVGMMAVGIVGAVFLGFAQDKEIERSIADYDRMNNTSLQEKYISVEKNSIFGTYQTLDIASFEVAPVQERQIIESGMFKAKKGALKLVAVLPVIMLISFIVLLLYFKKKGGYKQVEIT
ncbi:MAG TPA: MFS transporter [Bacteroidales bacterium]|nr:MFS transporter [Bacteroidales bacterium]HBQ81334.1 MFS transporter [Bacteroidales bacterium]HCU18112.1 MFS transporter [Bacteroidales bacterium]